MTSFGQGLIESAKEALAFARGEDNGCVVHIIAESYTTHIRRKINMSQSQFAAHFGVSVRTVQEWEQGRAVPSGPAQTLLKVIDHEPEAVRRALASPRDHRRAKVRQRRLTRLFKRLIRENNPLSTIIAHYE